MHGLTALMQKETMRAVATKRPECIKEPYDLLVGLDWFDAIYTFADCIGGNHVYVPSPRKIFAKCLEEEAKEEFGKTPPTEQIYAQFARKYGYSEPYMRKILADIEPLSVK